MIYLTGQYYCIISFKMSYPISLHSILLLDWALSNYFSMSFIKWRTLCFLRVGLDKYLLRGIKSVFGLFSLLILLYNKYDSYYHLFVLMCHETAGKRGGQLLEGYSIWTTSHAPRNGRDLPGTSAHMHISLTMISNDVIYQKKSTLLKLELSQWPRSYHL